MTLVPLLTHILGVGGGLGLDLVVWVGGGGVESEFSDRFGYSLALAKPNKRETADILRKATGNFQCQKLNYYNNYSLLWVW